MSAISVQREATGPTPVPTVAQRGPATTRPLSANTLILALVIALGDLELRRARGKVPTPLRIVPPEP